ncbi:MAG: DHA2 family efflux MFS transporter permease subunit [Micromonosporaceae bacterium]
MIIVDATIVNVAVPQIIKDLGITSSDAQWVQEVYTLVFAALLLVWGRLADRYGRRRLFAAGAIAFAAASVLAALSRSGPELIGSRVLQGIAGAMMLPTSLSLLNAGFRGRERAIAFAVWGSTIGGTAALGPLLGGWLTTSYSWRWAFGINIPLGIAVVAGTLLLVPESREAVAGRGNDLMGALLSVLGFGGIVFGLIQGRSYGWWARTGPVSIAGLDWRWPLSPVPVAFAAGVICLVAFAAVELRRNAAGRVVLLDLRLFAIPSFRNGNIAAAIVSLGEFGLLFALPLWFENVRGYSAFRTGIALLPLAIGSFAASGFGAQLARRRGPVFAVRLGIALEIAGVAGIGVVVGPATAWWATVPALFVYGVGVGLATAQLTGVVLADVPVANSGQGSGTQSTSRQIGSAFGIAILGTVLFTTLGAQLSQRLSGIPGLPSGQRAALVAGIKQSAGAVIGQLAADPHTAAVAAMAKQAFSQATRLTAFTAAVFLVLGLLASFSLSRGNAPHHTQDPDAGPDHQTGPPAQDPGNRAMADNARPRLPAEPRHTAHRGSRPGHSPISSATSFRRANHRVHGGLRRA